MVVLQRGSGAIHIVPRGVSHLENFQSSPIDSCDEDKNIARMPVSPMNCMGPPDTRHPKFKKVYFSSFHDGKESVGD